MRFLRQMYHHDGVTNLAQLRQDAQEAARKGEPVLLHLHPYEELFDGCGPTLRRQRALHEEYVTKEVPA